MVIQLLKVADGEFLQKFKRKNSCVKILGKFPEHIKREEVKSKKQFQEAVMKKTGKIQNRNESLSEFKKLPKKLQQLILKNLEEETTLWSDNRSGDNHYDGYSFY